MEKFLGDGEIPIYMDLQFDVGVHIIIGLLHFPPMTAPFDKPLGSQNESEETSYSHVHSKIHQSFS